MLSIFFFVKFTFFPNLDLLYKQLLNSQGHILGLMSAYCSPWVKFGLQLVSVKKVLLGHSRALCSRLVLPPFAPQWL